MLLRFSKVFDRESISHGPTGLKIVLGVLMTLVKSDVKCQSQKITKVSKHHKSHKKSQKSQVSKSQKSQKVSKVSKSHKMYVISRSCTESFFSLVCLEMHETFFY